MVTQVYTHDPAQVNNHVPTIFLTHVHTKGQTRVQTHVDTLGHGRCLHALRACHQAAIELCYRLYLGIADGKSITRVWACWYSK